MKKTFWYLSITAVLILTTISANAQEGSEDVAPEVNLDVIKSHVVRCETVEEMRQAQQQGAWIFEYKDRYFVKIGDKYEGVQSLEKAVWLRQQKGLPIPKQKRSPEEAESGYGLNYDLRLMLFPFMEAGEKEMLFVMPSGEPLPTSKIMIHPSPFLFEQVTFAPIDFSRSLEKLKVLGMEVPSPEELSEDLRSHKHFAVTGQIAPQPSIKLKPEKLTYWVGAAVLDEAGNTLMREYGKADSSLQFKITHPIKTERHPVYLLLFTLAEGRLQEMLRPVSGIPEMDATPYEYHILNSAALAMGPDWFPPLEEATQQEYQKMIEEAKKERKKAFEQLTKTTP